LTQGFPELLTSDASLSLRASVTNSRNGIPRAAATDLARRKTLSGISKVVFTNECSHIYGSESIRVGTRHWNERDYRSIHFQRAAISPGLIRSGANFASWKQGRRCSRRLEEEWTITNARGPALPNSLGHKVSKGRVPCGPLLIHSGQHGHESIGIVVHEHFFLVLVKPVQPTDILLKRPSP